MEFTEAILTGLESEKLTANINESVFHFDSEEKDRIEGKEEEKEEREEEKAEGKAEESVIPPLDISMSKDWVIKGKFTNLMEERRQPGYINTSKYNGPTDESNWILFKTPGYKMGALLLGGYPDRPGYLDALLASGINTFVNLCLEYGTYDGGDYYPPYANDKKKIPDGRFVNEPIKDMNTTDDGKLDRLATEVCRRLLDGENIYMHCAGGHGRTGTLATLVIHKLYPHLALDEIFEYIQFAHDQRNGSCFNHKLYISSMMIDPMAFYMVCGQVPSPQTLKQRNQLRRLFGLPEVVC